MGQLKGFCEIAQQLARDMLRKQELCFGDSLMAPTLSLLDSGSHFAQLKYFLLHLLLICTFFLLIHLNNYWWFYRLGSPMADIEMQFEELSIH